MNDMKKSIFAKILISLSAGLISAAASFVPAQASSFHQYSESHAVHLTVQWAEDAYVRPVNINGSKKYILRVRRDPDVQDMVAEDFQSLTGLTVAGSPVSYTYEGYDEITINSNSGKAVISERYSFSLPFSFSADTNPTIFPPASSDSPSLNALSESPAFSPMGDYALNGHFNFSITSASVTTSDGQEKSILKTISARIFPTGFKVKKEDGSFAPEYFFEEYHLPDVSDPLVLSTEEYEQCTVTVTGPEYDYVVKVDENNRPTAEIFSMSYVITYSPKYVNIQLQKVWDASVPESERHPVTVHLTRDGEIYPADNSFTLSADNNWAFTDASISHLLQYNPETGEAYSYSLVEDGNAYQTSSSMITSGDTVTVELVNAKIPSTPVPAAPDKVPVPRTSAESRAFPAPDFFKKIFKKYRKASMPSYSSSFESMFQIVFFAIADIADQLTYTEFG